MTRTKVVNGSVVSLSAEEEAARDAEEAAWLAAANDRAVLAADPPVDEILTALLEQVPAPAGSALADVIGRRNAAQAIRNRGGV